MFNVYGIIDIGAKRKFKKEVDAPTESAAKERIYALFGSQNGLKRSSITIEKIESG